MASSDDDSSSSYSTPSSATPYSRTPYSSTPYKPTPSSSTPYSSTPYKPTPSSSTTYPSVSYSSTPSSSSSSSSDSSSNSTPSKSGDDNSGESNNGDNSNNSSGGNSNTDNGNNNSGGDSSKDKDDGENDNSGSSRQNNNNNSEQNDNDNSEQNNNNSGQNNSSNQNNNGNRNNNNNNGGNSNSQSSQGNNSPPKSSSNYWRAPPTPLESSKSPPTAALSGNDSKAPSRSTSTPVIIGLAAGAGMLFFVMILLFLACSKRKKKRQSSHLMDKVDGSDYWQSGPHKPNEHILNMPSPPLASSGWTNPGQHQPPMISSEMNSSNFSGPHGPPLPPPHPSMALGFNTSTFSYGELAVATSGFSQAKLLGQGGFGFVHKGVLPNGKEIAVKSLKSGSGQGDREFAAEVEIISRVHHRHLVSLVGYCLNGDRKLLVYEFVPNNNLEFHLYKNHPPLDWASRIKIALGSAKGLAYLHEDCHPKIIHRDIKAANILIDYNYEAKVADFGLAKLNQENVTHVSTRVMGTFGYLAPEYASSGKLTEKSDVFSFGIMLLELITGRRPVDTTGEYEEDTLVDWAQPLCLKAIEDGNYSELADPRLENKYDQEEMTRMVACASTSVRHSAKKRPKMSQIVRVLEGDVSLEDLHKGIKPSPSFLFGGSATSSDFDSDSYNANMNFRKQTTLGGSQDYPSSEEMVRKA